MSIKKGQVVTFKPEWQDAGDENITFIAADDEEKGRVKVMSLLGLEINPTQVVSVDMISTARDFVDTSKLPETAAVRGVVAKLVSTKVIAGRTVGKYEYEIDGSGFYSWLGFKGAELVNARSPDFFS